MISKQIHYKSYQPSTFLLGFIPFFYKELQEWKQKKSAIITLIAIPLLMSILLVLLTKYLNLKTALADLTSVSTSFAVNSFWISSVAILLSIGLIPKEVDSGTMAWNLTKPLSRTSFLLGKWLATTLITWLIAIVL